MKTKILFLMGLIFCWFGLMPEKVCADQGGGADKFYGRPGLKQKWSRTEEVIKPVGVHKVEKSDIETLDKTAAALEGSEPEISGQVSEIARSLEAKM